MYSSNDFIYDDFKSNNIWVGDSMEEKQKKTSIWLLIKNKEKGFSYFKYFDTEYEKDLYKDKIKWVTNLYVIEDSSDMNWNYS